jgi:predicted PurR-regulated permease PerM
MPDDRPGHPDWRSMHLWQFQPVRDVLGIAAIIGLLWVGHRLSVVTVPILLALMLAYLFEPLVRFVTRRGWFSRPGSAIAIIIAGFFILVVPASVGIGTAVVQGAGVARSLAATSADFLKVARFSREAMDPASGKRVVPPSPDASPPVVQFKGDGEQQAKDATAAEAAYNRLPRPVKVLTARVVTGQHPAESPEPAPRGAAEGSALFALVDMGLTWVQDNASAVAAAFGRQALGGGAEALGAVVRTAARIGTLALTLFLTAFFFYFFCTGYGRVLGFWESLIPERRRSRVVDLVQKMDRVIAGFVRGRLTIAFCLQILYTIGYWFIGVPAPLLMGLVVGALAIIPFVSTIAMPMAMILMIVSPEAAHWAWQQSWWWIVLGPVLLYASERVLDDYILTPAIQGKHTGMDTPSILFASLAGGVLAGVYGLLIAIPTAACLKIVLNEVFWPRFKAWAEGREKDFLPISRDDQHRAPGA